MFNDVDDLERGVVTGGELGHGLHPAHLHFSEHFVIKRCKTEFERDRMSTSTQVFVPIIAQRGLEIVMQRHRAPQIPGEVHEALSHGAFLLRHHLWFWKAEPHPNWKDLLRAHLDAIFPHFNWKIILSALPDTVNEVKIHGDATVANMLYVDTLGWRWCDPLDRPYVPGDPHVDLGKMFQSLLGYEAILLGQQTEVKLDAKSALNLSLNLGLNYTVGLAWCYIHVARLLRYQRPEVRNIFTRWLTEQLESLYDRV